MNKITFLSQKRICETEGMVIKQGGQEFNFTPFSLHSDAKKRLLMEMEKNNDFIKFKVDGCKRFGGNCWNSNIECRKMRGL